MTAGVSCYVASMTGVRLTVAERRELRLAIEAAERGHRGEIHVHLEARYPGDGPLARASALFAELGVDATRDATGVLLYVAERDRKAAVYAGAGVYGARAHDFWREVTTAVADGYARGDRMSGLVRAIAMIGAVLLEASPGQDDAGNELPNEATIA